MSEYNNAVSIAIKNNLYELLGSLIANNTKFSDDLFLELIQKNNSASLYFAHRILDKELVESNYFYGLSKYYKLIPAALANNQYKLVYNLIKNGAGVPIKTFIDLIKQNKPITIDLANLAINKKVLIEEGTSDFHYYSYDRLNLVDLVIEHKQPNLAISFINAGAYINDTTYEKLIKENDFVAGWLASISFNKIKCTENEKSSLEGCNNNLLNLAVKYSQYDLAYNLIHKDIKVAPNLFAELIDKNKPQELFLAEEILKRDTVTLNPFGYDFVDLAVKHKQYSLVETLISKDTGVSLDVLKKLIQHNNTIATYLVDIILEKNKANMKALDHEFTDLVVTYNQYDLAKKLIDQEVKFSSDAYEKLTNLGLFDNSSQLLGDNINNTHEEL